MRIPAMFDCTNKRKVWTLVRSTRITKGNPAKRGVLHIACESFGLPRRLILSLKLIEHTYLRQKSDGFLSIRCLQHAKLYMTYFINCVHIFLEWQEGIIGFFVFFNHPPVLLVGSFLVLIVICAVAWSCIHIVFQCF